VASDGAITETRKAALEKVAEKAGFTSASIAFVTAFPDREHHAFRRCVSSLAWQSFAWFAAEPDNLVVMRSGANCRRPLGDYLSG